MNHSAILQAIDSFASLKVLVIGDVILDAYFQGKVNRISPEAPVSILDVKSKEYRLGGAANVALNIKGLGARAILCSVTGNDEHGQRLATLMEAEGVNTAGIIRSTSRITSVKTRLMSGHHQLLRMDEEQTDMLNAQDNALFMEKVESLIEHEKPDVIIFEDYDKGVLSEPLITRVITLATQMGIPTAVDPKREHFFAYKGATLFKPNMRELSEGLGQPALGSDKTSLEKAFRELNAHMPVSMGFFTLSSEGVYITNGKESYREPARVRTIADVSGAGDTVISVAACCLAAGLGMAEIAFVSNLAGGWVCQFPGVVAIEAGALKSELTKIAS